MYTHMISLSRYSALLPLLLVLLFCPGYSTAADELDWEKLDPAFSGATFVNDTDTCRTCHPDYVKAYHKTIHGKVFSRGPQSELQARGCEACHGPRSRHIANPGDPDLRVSLKMTGDLPPVKRNKVCLQCHEEGITTHWRGSTHEISGVSCGACHYVMERRSETRLFVSEDPKAACFACHPTRRAQLQRSSHMPMREGLMECADCHNPHGGPGPKLLKTATINETCYQCHPEKRGPMLFEHPPVRERCTNCHEPHGSNYATLLKRKVPYLCQQCHSAEFHPSSLYEGSGLPGGAAPAQQLIGKGCLNCHSNVHGSNHPSGARFQR